jgi:hypothetical protein
MKVVAIIAAIIGAIFFLDCLFGNVICSGLCAVALFVVSMGCGIIYKLNELKK